MTKNNRNGNALWFILIAIFLLGGLTVLLSRTGGQTDETGNIEQASIKASELIRYAAGIKAATDRLLSQRCSESQISYNSNFNTNGTENTSAQFYNPNAPANFSCHVFHANGAGMMRPNSSYAFYLQSIHNVGTVKNDVYFNTRADKNNISISTDVCAAINKQLRNNLNISTLPKADISSNLFVGNFSVTYPTLGDDGDEVGMAGLKSACITDTTCGTGECVTFYSVLITR